jgi:uncharacterized protein YtpQ (UPF0354 family)
MRFFASFFAALTLLFVVGCKRAPDAEAQLRAALLDAMPGASVEKKEDGLAVKFNGREVDVGLDNLRRACASSTAECDGAIRMTVKTTQETLSTVESSDAPARSTLRPTLKPAEWIENADQMMKSKLPEKFSDNRIIRRPFAADIFVVYVADSANKQMMLNQQTLRDLKLTEDELNTLALENLKKAYPKLTLTEMTPGIFTFEPGDEYDCARLLLVDQWAEEAKKAGGKLIASAPARSRVFVARAPSPKALDAVKKIVKMAHAQEDHPISEALVEWSGTGWKSEFATSEFATPR